MRTPVHPNGAGLLVVIDVLLDRNQFLRYRISLFPNAKIERPAVDVLHAVHFALMFREREAGSIVAQSRQPRPIRDGNTQVVNQLRTRPALARVLMKYRTPVASQI